MPRKKPEHNATTWEDISECVPAWEAEKGVRVVCHISWDSRLSSGAYVEVVLFSGRQVGQGTEVLRVRQPFPARKSAGQAGAVMHAIFLAFNELDANPWLWPMPLRRKARGEG